MCTACPIVAFRSAGTDAARALAGIFQPPWFAAI